MKIEIIEAYPLQTQDKEDSYSMHAYIPDIDLDIRGIVVKFRKKWMFFLPNMSNLDPDTKKRISFSNVGFANNKKNQDLKDSLIIEGTKYMQDKYLDIQNKKRMVSLKSKKKPSSNANKISIQGLKTQNKHIIQKQPT